GGAQSRRVLQLRALRASPARRRSHADAEPDLRDQADAGGDLPRGEGGGRPARARARRVLRRGRSRAPRAAAAPARRPAPGAAETYRCPRAPPRTSARPPAQPPRTPLPFPPPPPPPP